MSRVIKSWASVGRPTVNPERNTVEFHFADGDVQEMRDGMLDGRWWLSTAFRPANGPLDEVLIVLATPQRKQAT